MKKPGLILLAQTVVLIAAFSGCRQNVDLAAIRKYAQVATVAQPPFEQMARDLYGTCFRKTEYARTSAFGEIPYSDPRVFPEPPSISSSSSTPYKQECQEAAFQAAQWATRDDIVIDYVRSLGAIAGVETKPQHLDELAGKLENVGTIASGQAKPFSNLATAIAQELVAANQRESIAKFAQEAKPNLAHAITSLNLIATNYSTLLRDERLSLNILYRSAIGKEDPIHQRLLILRQREDWDRRLHVLESKQRAVQAYSKSLQDIAQMNSAIVERASGASLSDIAQVANQYADAFSGDVSDVISALKN